MSSLALSDNVSSPDGTLFEMGAWSAVHLENVERALSRWVLF